MFDLFSNSNGHMTYSDFISAIIDLKGEVTSEILLNTFLMIQGGEVNEHNRNFITRQ